MGLVRLLSLLLLASAAWYLYRNFMRKQLKQQDRHKTTDPVPVVKCSYCELHLPRHQAVEHGAEWFCTPAHRQAWLGGNKRSSS